MIQSELEQKFHFNLRANWLAQITEEPEHFSLFVYANAVSCHTALSDATNKIAQGAIWWNSESLGFSFFGLQDSILFTVTPNLSGQKVLLWKHFFRIGQWKVVLSVSFQTKCKFFFRIKFALFSLCAFYKPSLPPPRRSFICICCTWTFMKTFVGTGLGPRNKWFNFWRDLDQEAGQESFVNDL